jgi:two-component system cell cycle sensor histidine kinase PleC
MSHDLRTPLNAVIGFAEIMKEEALGPLGAPEYQEYATLILRGGLSLLDMITNLLDFARADAGILPLSLGDVEVTRLLRSAAAGTRDEVAAATGKAQACVDVAPCPGRIAIRADEHRLRQLLRALIGNALKLTPPDGQVRIDVQALAGGGVAVVVSDTGIGMPPEAMEHDGAGIGLKLAWHLARLHGGSLTLERARGQGTRAVLTLPQAPPA